MSSRSTLKALYLKETAAYFNAPTAYILAVVFLLITGYFFAWPLFLNKQSSIDSFTDFAPLLIIFLMPAVTMKHISEEAKTGTLEILMTFPVKDWEIVLSKFLSAMTVLAMTLGLTLAYPLSVAFLGKLDPGAVAGAYLGLFFTGGMLAAAGLFASSLTRNQVVAFIIAFLIGFVLFVMGKISQFIPIGLLPVIDFIGFDSHLSNLSRGIFDTRDLLYYFSMSGFFLFAAQIRLWLVRTH